MEGHRPLTAFGIRLRRNFSITPFRYVVRGSPGFENRGVVANYLDLETCFAREFTNQEEQLAMLLHYQNNLASLSRSVCRNSSGNIDGQKPL